MYTVEVSVPIRPGRRLTDDEITDLVEAIIDDLDTTATDPSVCTTRDGHDVRVSLSVAVDHPDPLTALAEGSEAMRAAFQAANAVAGGTLAVDGLRSEVRPLRAV